MVEDGVAAMIAICRAFPKCVAIVLGVGELESRLRAMIGDAGLEQRVIPAGKVDQAALASIVRDSIFISPLAGMALIETSLAGAVPVVYDRDWQSEFVKDGVNGFVVPIRDISAMAARAGQLIGVIPLRQQMSQAAREAGRAYADPESQRAREHATFRPLIDANFNSAAPRR